MLADELGKFVSEIRYEDVPAEMLAGVKIRLLDVLTGALVGFHFNNYKHVLPLLAPGDDATMWGNGRRLSLRDATLMNAFLAHSTYLEDGSRHTGGHPSSGVMPAAIALAEKQHASGTALLVAIVAGYEVFQRLGRAMFPSMVVRGFQSTPVLAGVGSAAACSNLLRLQPDAAKNALAMGSMVGVGLKEALKCPSSQPLQVGRSCEGGLMGALVAKEGAVGADSILEQGFLKAFADKAVATHVLTDLGSKFTVLDTYLKVHGGCRATHAPVDAVQAAISKNNIKAEDIERIVIRVASVPFADDIPDPRDGSQAQFSSAFAIAVLLLEGNASIFHFTDERVHDPRVRAMMAKVKMQTDPEQDKVFPAKRGACADIVLKDGRRLTERMDYAKGEPENPLSGAEIEQKFLLHTKRVLGSNTERVRDMVMTLEKLPDISALVAVLKNSSVR